MAAEEAFWLEDLRTWGDGSDVPEEDDGIEAALLNYGRMRASRWGAERFAAEFRRRDEEEQQQLRAEAAERSLLRSDRRPVRRPMMLTGLVDASVEDKVIGAEPGRLEFVGRHRAEPDVGPVIQPWRAAATMAAEAPFRLDIKLANEADELPKKLADQPPPVANELQMKLADQPSPVANELQMKLADQPSPVANELHKKLTDHPSPVADELHKKLADHPSPVADELHSKLVDERSAVVDELQMRLADEPPATASEPKVVRHPHVPRPPAPAPEPEVKRNRFARRRAAAPSRAPAISSAELARMTPAARRLYGLDQ